MPRQMIALRMSAAERDYRVNAEMFGPLGVHPELIYDADSPYGTGYIFHKKRWQITHRNGRMIASGIESGLAARVVAIAITTIATDIIELDDMLDGDGKVKPEFAEQWKEVLLPLQPFLKELRFNGLTI